MFTIMRDTLILLFWVSSYCACVNVSPALRFWTADKGNCPGSPSNNHTSYILGQTIILCLHLFLYLAVFDTDVFICNQLYTFNFFVLFPVNVLLFLKQDNFHWEIRLNYIKIFQLVNASILILSINFIKYILIPHPYFCSYIYSAIIFCSETITENFAIENIFSEATNTTFECCCYSQRSVFDGSLNLEFNNRQLMFNI